MQQIHNVEEIDSQTPLICIYGKYSEFTQRLIDQWLPQFKIIYIDTIHPEKNNENKNFYFIKSEEISLITKLQEKIDYAVAFLQSADDKVHIDALSKKLIQGNTKSLIIVPVIELQDYADIILTFKKERNIFFATIGEFIHGDNQFATIIRKIIAEQKRDGQVEKKEPPALIVPAYKLDKLFCRPSHSVFLFWTEVLYQEKKDYSSFLSSLAA